MQAVIQVNFASLQYKKQKTKTRNSSLSSDGDFIVSNHGQLIQMEKTVSWVAPMRKMKGWWLED